MKSFLRDGKTHLYTNAGSAIASGAVVLLGMFQYGIATTTIAATTGTGLVATKGVYRLDKTTSQTYAVGDRLYWDPSTSKVTNVPAQLGFIGFAAAAAASAATSCDVELKPFVYDAPRRVALSATGAQSIAKEVFFGGKPVLAVIANTAAVALTLPDSTTIPGACELQVCKTGGGAFALTVTPAGSDTVNGTTTHAAIDADNDEARYQVNGTDWRIIASTIA